MEFRCCFGPVPQQRCCPSIINRTRIRIETRPDCNRSPPTNPVSPGRMLRARGLRTGRTGPAGCSSSSSSRASNVTRDLYENRKYHTLVPCYPVNNRRSCSQLQLTMIGMDSAGAAAAAASGFAKANRYDQSANVDDEDLDDDGGNYLSFKKLWQNIV